MVYVGFIRSKSKRAGIYTIGVKTKQNPLNPWAYFCQEGGSAILHIPPWILNLGGLEISGKNIIIENLKKKTRIFFKDKYS